jgi:hypothetical protein
MYLCISVGFIRFGPPSYSTHAYNIVSALKNYYI